MNEKESAGTACQNGKDRRASAGFTDHAEECSHIQHYH